MKYSWWVSFKKAIVQVIVLVLTGGLTTLASNLPPVSENPSVQVLVFYVLFVVLNMLRNWLKQNTALDKVL
ncbi:MAG: hypothetical protein KatS3mg096_810 [Candidatus Parcubacteria bacterium]|nr:MAG: hypothetical protein KatS3mg096_810 [Candidatus Parcubacteria bacterium]